MDDRTVVYLVTGFLGSGKTTFLNRVIASFPRDRKLMILMNEFGEVGIDGALIEGEDIDILEINKGSIFCVCVKTDFIKALHQIAQIIKPEVLFIESTGVANPMDLKKDLKLPFFQNRFYLSEQFCIVDAVNFGEACETFASVEKQIASSTVFIINKVDLASADQLRDVKNLIARHHPNPRIFETTFAEVPLNNFFPVLHEKESTIGVYDQAAGPFLSPTELEAAIDEVLADPHREVTPPDRLVSAVYRWQEAGLQTLWSLAERLPKGVVRAKGFVTVEDDTYLFSLVMGYSELVRYSLPQVKADLMNRLVFIAPPEVMSQLEELTGEFPAFCRESMWDPLQDCQRE
jgi:G3E family GTPase